MNAEMTFVQNDRKPDIVFGLKDIDSLPVSGNWIDCCSDGTRVVAISGSTAVSTS